MSASIHFYIRSERPNKDGSAQIYMVFTLNRSLRAKMSTNKNAPLKKEFNHLTQSEILAFSRDVRDDLYHWDKKLQRLTKNAPNADKINKYLDGEKKRANDIILKHELLNQPLTLESFVGEFAKISGNKLFADYFLAEFNKREGRWSKETLRSYKSIVTKIQQFRPNLTLAGINYKFLTELENYMLTSEEAGGCGNTPRTVANNMKVLRTLLLIAIKNRDFTRENYPFTDYRVTETTKELTTRDYLEPEEIDLLEAMISGYQVPEKPVHKLSPQDWAERAEKKMLSPGEYDVLRRFLFSCYTGLRFRDMRALKRANIFEKSVETVSGQAEKRYFIEITMHKTGNPVGIPLIDKALRLIDLKSLGNIFDFITNQRINEHLREIQKKSGINKHLTFHVSRHSFATICFLYGIEERVGQKLLGHKNRKFTEIYTHLSQAKLFQEMDKLSAGLNKLGKVNETDTSKSNDIYTLLKGLPPDKLEQVKGIIRVLR